MESFIKTETYFNLVEQLERNSKFYTEPFSNYNLIGIDRISVPTISAFHADDFFNALNKIRITTPDDEMNEFYNMLSEVRHRVLTYISKIPIGQKAIEIFLSKYKIVVEKDEQKAQAWKIDVDLQEIFEMDDNEIITSRLVSKRDLLESWKINNDIPKLFADEIVLNEICNFFQTNRELVNLEKTYSGIDLRKIIRNIDLKELANELIQNKYLIPVQHNTFESLLGGSSCYEPLVWLGGLADLNKFIKSIFSLGHQREGKPKIEWKTFAQFIVIDNAFQDADNIKGSTSAKMESVQELKPFLSIVKSCVLKN